MPIGVLAADLLEVVSETYLSLQVGKQRLLVSFGMATAVSVVFTSFCQCRSQGKRVSCLRRAVVSLSLMPLRMLPGVASPERMGWTLSSTIVLTNKHELHCFEKRRTPSHSGQGAWGGLLKQKLAPKH